MISMKRFKTFMKRQQAHDSSDRPPYFTREENRETVRPWKTKQKRVWKEEIKIVASDELEYHEHRYESGAMYKGTWLGQAQGNTTGEVQPWDGGLRHGEGQMIWPDSAEYTGTWHCNQASR